MRLFSEEEQEILTEIENWTCVQNEKNTRICSNEVILNDYEKIIISEKINFDMENFDDFFHHVYHKWIFTLTAK